MMKTIREAAGTEWYEELSSEIPAPGRASSAERPTRRRFRGLIESGHMLSESELGDRLQVNADERAVRRFEHNDAYGEPGTVQWSLVGSPVRSVGVLFLGSLGRLRASDVLERSEVTQSPVESGEQELVHGDLVLFTRGSGADTILPDSVVALEER